MWQPHGKDVVHVVSDCGYSYKKATHMLLDACIRLRDEGYPIRLSIIGPTARREEPFWAAYRHDGRHAGWASLHGHLQKDEIEEFLLAGDVYCSASLSEGSSNAILFAFALGMPMVCGATGSLPDLNDDPRDLVHLFTPGDPESLADALRSAAETLVGGSAAPDPARCAQIRRRLSVEAEREHWRELVLAVGERP